MKKEKIFIVAYPYVFREFDWQRFELDIVSKYCKVHVHELYRLYDNKWENVYQSRSERPEITTYNTVSTWLEELRKIKKKYGRRNIYILDFFHFDTKIDFVLLKFLIAFTGANVINLSLVGTIAEKSRLLEPLLYKLKNYGGSHLYRMMRIVVGHLLVRLYYFAMGKHLHILIGGVDSELYQNKLLKSAGCYLHSASSWDYSNWLTLSEPVQSPVSGNYAVFIDAAGPRHRGDYWGLNIKMLVTSDQWYPAVCRFFQVLEERFTEKIIVAAHPKVRIEEFPADYEGRRNFSTHDDKLMTMRLVAGSDFVITVNSTAISYAVIFNKPIIFITSNQRRRYPPETLEYDDRLYRAFDATPINIDSFCQDEISKHLTVKSEIYADYKKAFLTLSGGVANSDIIVGNIMKLRHAELIT